MIDHVSIGASDIERTVDFYRAVLRPMMWECLVDLPGRAGFGRKYPELWVLARPAMRRLEDDTPVHVALRAASRDIVDQVHAAALTAGGTCGGAPRLRAYSMSNAYAAFLRDPDGNRIEVVHFPQAR